jgi:hypothetical protein
MVINIAVFSLKRMRPGGPNHNERRMTPVSGSAVRGAPMNVAANVRTVHSPAAGAMQERT